MPEAGAAEKRRSYEITHVLGDMYDMCEGGEARLVSV